MKAKKAPLVAIRCDEALLSRLKDYARQERLNLSAAMRLLMLEGMRQKGIEVPKNELAGAAVSAAEN